MPKSKSKPKPASKLKSFITVIILILIIAALLILFGLFDNFNLLQKNKVQVSNFNECVNAGYPVMESYPRQCRAGKQIFTEYIGNQLEKTDVIQVNTPLPNQAISNPVIIEGRARGYWFFEADAPIIIKDSMGNIVGQGIAQAKGNWMTVNFVNFQAQVNFTQPQSLDGEIILQKDNPSGLPENDDQLTIPVKFKL